MPGLTVCLVVLLVSFFSVGGYDLETLAEESTPSENEPQVTRKLLGASDSMVDSVVSLVAVKQASKRCVQHQLNKHYVK